MSSPVKPMLILTGVAYGNNVYNHQFAPSAFADVKPLLFGGIATTILALAGQAPGMDKVATRIGWLALIGYLLAGGSGKGSPVGNVLALTGNGGK